MIRALALATTLSACTVPIIADGYKDVTRTNRAKSDLDYWTARCGQGIEPNFIGQMPKAYYDCMYGQGWLLVERRRVN